MIIRKIKGWFKNRYLQWTIVLTFFVVLLGIGLYIILNQGGEEILPGDYEERYELNVEEQIKGLEEQ